jgi:hypothetical protein
VKSKYIFFFFRWNLLLKDKLFHKFELIGFQFLKRSEFYRKSVGLDLLFTNLKQNCKSFNFWFFFTSKTKQQQKSGNRWGFSFNSYANTVEPYVTESEFGSFCVPPGPKSYSIGSFAVFLKSCVPPVNRSPIPEVMYTAGWELLS